MKLLAIWTVLLLLLGAECLASRIPAMRGITPFIGLGMAALVATTFMRLAQGRGLVPVFAVASLFWLAIMMGLGSLDSLTRHDLSVGQRTEPIGAQ